MVSLVNRLPEPKEFDMVFVIGLHKSGTSLLTEHLGNRFYDTSRETNPNERGYGTTVARYLTRECKIVRQINEVYRTHSTLLFSAQNHNNLDRSRKRKEMTTFIESWQNPIVIKSPFFAYSLDDWLTSAKTLGRKSCVCVTRRSPSDVKAEWNEAPFTKDLLAHGEFDRLCDGIMIQINKAKAISVDVREFLYEEIISLQLIV